MADLLANRLQLVRYLPTITTWNRVEGRPRAEDFDRSMRAEVRDALWMVSRQWQMGEFIGDDAGSPILAKVHMKTTQLTKYRGGSGPVGPIEPDVPLEVEVENKKIPFRQGEAARPFHRRCAGGAARYHPVFHANRRIVRCDAAPALVDV